MIIVFFGTSGCHLCDEALAIMSNQFPQVKVDMIDIAEQVQWQEKYAVKIPVLFHRESGKELCWPFSESDVDEFISVVESD